MHLANTSDSKSLSDIFTRCERTVNPLLENTRSTGEELTGIARMPLQALNSLKSQGQGQGLSFGHVMKQHFDNMEKRVMTGIVEGFRTGVFDDEYAVILSWIGSAQRLQARQREFGSTISRTG